MKSIEALSRACCLCALAVLGAPVHADTLDEIREANNACLAAVKTGRVQYICESQESETGLSPEAARALAKALASRPEELAVAMKKVELNLERRERVAVYFNAEAGEWKRISSDLRNLEHMLAKESLPLEKRASLETSNIELVGGDVLAHFDSASRCLLVDRQAPLPAGTSPILRSPVPFGVVPDYFFQNILSSSIEDSSTNGRAVLRVSLEAPEGKRVLEVDPQIGYHCRQLDLYSRAGELGIRSTFGDYRLVNGVHFPFAFERSEYNSKGDIKRYQKIVVESAEFNHPLPPDALQLALPARVPILGLDRPYQFLLTHDQMLRVDELRTLIDTEDGGASPTTVPAGAKNGG